MLVDTSVWVDHFRDHNAALAVSLERAEVHCHPLVIGELACGNLARREQVLSLLAALPQTPEARHLEVLSLIEAHRLSGRGIGWVDAHLLASAMLGNVKLWTLDKRLRTIAGELGAQAEAPVSGDPD